MDFQSQVYQAVYSVPSGKVATYGDIAALAGQPKHARQVGKILSQLPKDSKLPWFRIINSQGRLSFPVDSPAYQRQRSLLEADGIEFQGERISLKHYRWR